MFTKEEIHEARCCFNQHISEKLNGLNLCSPNLYDHEFVNIYYRTEPTFHENPELNDRTIDSWTGSKEYQWVVSFWLPLVSRPDIRVLHLNKVYYDMQGSMSVGDLVEFPSDGSIYECASSGWRKIR
jgi:hypothetical protein